jgi:hypothetical protein
MIACPLLMLWTAPATGLARSELACTATKGPMSFCGYERPFGPDLQLVRKVPRSGRRGLSRLLKALKRTCFGWCVNSRW